MAMSLQRRIKRVKREMFDLGPVHPGRISEQYNVCGTRGCRCKDKKNPRKHGPYYYLSYTFQKKSRTLFIPPTCVEEMRKRNERYVRLKALMQELLDAEIQLARQEVLQREPLE